MPCRLPECASLNDAVPALIGEAPLDPWLIVAGAHHVNYVARLMDEAHEKFVEQLVVIGGLLIGRRLNDDGVVDADGDPFLVSVATKQVPVGLLGKPRLPLPEPCLSAGCLPGVPQGLLTVFLVRAPVAGFPSLQGEPELPILLVLEVGVRLYGQQRLIELLNGFVGLVIAAPGVEWIVGVSPEVVDQGLV